jgi:hypothetical protein
MNSGRQIKDSFVVGLIGGSVTLVFFFYLFSAIRAMLVSMSGNLYMLRPPAVQLFTMVVNVILFRILIINFQKEKTAKGLLFITVIATLAYFFIFFRLRG